MIASVFRKKRNGVPIVTKEELDSIGERLVQDFCPQALIDPQPIDIDRFVTSYLGLKLDYQYLSHCGVYLGMTVFNDTDRVPVYCPQKKRAEYISVKAGTVIIDSHLLSEKNEGRYRYTMGHEGGHGFMHYEFFEHNPNQLSLLQPDSAPMIQCRVDNSREKGKPPTMWNDHDRMEWQANRLSSVILMPASMVRKVVLAPRRQQIVDGDLPSYYTGKLAHLFKVSYDAAFYRLKDLALIPRNAYINKSAAEFFRYY
ncbi:ImmA/IrrE family metallo-endopeptidase [Ruminococcaceae bacterium OttesenSCG-928-A16]|nr:ImmA/IrrE family metallo-endopeptidase [Ruminococcaceae bacterium OttesenSCG-928-A16]